MIRSIQKKAANPDSQSVSPYESINEIIVEPVRHKCRCTSKLVPRRWSVNQTIHFLNIGLRVNICR